MRDLTNQSPKRSTERLNDRQTEWVRQYSWTQQSFMFSMMDLHSWCWLSAVGCWASFVLIFWRMVLFVPQSEREIALSWLIRIRINVTSRHLNRYDYNVENIIFIFFHFHNFSLFYNLPPNIILRWILYTVEYSFFNSFCLFFTSFLFELLISQIHFNDAYYCFCCCCFVFIKWCT